MSQELDQQCDIQKRNDWGSGRAAVQATWNVRSGKCYIELGIVKGQLRSRKIGKAEVLCQVTLPKLQIKRDGFQTNKESCMQYLRPQVGIVSSF